jgi:hypothetical protein
MWLSFCPFKKVILLYLEYLKIFKLRQQWSLGVDSNFNKKAIIYSRSHVLVFTNLWTSSLDIVKPNIKPSKESACFEELVNISWALHYHIWSNFWKFYRIQMDCTLGEQAFLVKVFRLFRLKQIFFVFRVWTQ